MKTMNRALLSILFPIALLLAGCPDDTGGVSTSEVNQAIADHAAQSGAHHTQVTTGAVTRSVRVGPSTFRGMGMTLAPTLQQGYLTTDGAGVAQAFASVRIPVGATITGVACTWVLPDAGTMSVTLVSYDSAGNETTHVSLAATVTGPNYATPEATNVASPQVQAGSDFAFLLLADPAGAIQFTDNRLKSCRVDYTAVEVIP